eukprot:1295267-Pyramimonas_sp.AAC.1
MPTVVFRPEAASCVSLYRLARQQRAASRPAARRDQFPVSFGMHSAIPTRALTTQGRPPATHDKGEACAITRSSNPVSYTHLTLPTILLV